MAQACPLCGSAVPRSVRYPIYLCPACVRRATSFDGVAVTFSNASFSGGLVVRARDTGEVLSDDQGAFRCVVDGVECVADEAHMGGIVVIPGPEPDRFVDR